MYSTIPRPGVVLGQYPEHTKFESDSMRLAFENALDATKRRLKLGAATPKLETVVNLVDRYQTQLESMSEAVMTMHIQRLRSKLVCHGLEDETMALSFATIREVSKRTLGMRHFNVQLFGGWIMVRGMVAEMETGEGKTLTSTLASCTAALAGIPVHVITANDYLASRDASTLSPLYHRLGLTVATVIEGMEPEQRQRSYQANIVHTTNKQIAFDYLRDRLAIGQDRGELRFQFKQIYHQNKGHEPLLLRGLCFAIIDEIDNVLVDEARTPLVLAQQQSQTEQQQLYAQALTFAEMLVQALDLQ